MFRPSSVSAVFCLFLSILLGSSGVRVFAAQTLSSSIYRNLVGEWVGYDDYVQGGKSRHVPVSISIAMEKDGKSVRLNYVYATKGDPDFTKYTKFVEIDTTTSMLSFRLKHQTASRYKIDSLADFEKTGLGKLSAIGADAPGFHSPGDGSTGRFNLELGLDTFNYTWESKPLGGDFEVVSAYTLHRSVLAPSN